MLVYKFFLNLLALLFGALRLRKKGNDTMTNNQNSNCQQLISRAALIAAKTPATFMPSFDRRLFVKEVAAMLLEMSSLYKTGLTTAEANALAEAKVPDFARNFDYALYTSAPCGKLLYAHARMALMQRLGREASAELCVSVA